VGYMSPATKRMQAAHERADNLRTSVLDDLQAGHEAGTDELAYLLASLCLEVRALTEAVCDFEGTVQAGL
jgi:hypothetical protein